MPWWFIINLVIAVALAVISYALTPKPKKQQPPASRDQDDPTASAGRPMPVFWGTVTITGPNVIHFTDKGKLDFEVAA